MVDQTRPALALEAVGISKSFGRPVLTGLSLSLRPGEVYALLGKNGAGKTTLLRIITGLTPPDEGAVSICGLSTTTHPVEARRISAWLPDTPMVYGKLTPTEYLEFMAGLWSVPAAEVSARGKELLEWLQLWDRRDDRCETFSSGMLQKVALAGALIHKPHLILFDEPMTGLDVSSVRLMKDFLRRFTAEGGTVLMTTHLLDVAERIADRIGVIHDGRLVAEGTLDELRSSSGTPGGTLEDLFGEITSSVT